MHVFESHIQWKAVKEVVERLQAKGFQALLAGGCVRDMLMGRVPNDFDIATGAEPADVEALFPKALTVGRDFGVTILPYDGFQVEVATFRQDGPYLDGRRPSSIAFSTPEEDARRRDFTVNALFYDLIKDEILDFVGGQGDIKARLIRAVGDPDRRFDEDKLRILRAVRFAAQLEFAVEPGTMAAVRARGSEIRIVAAERVRDELAKLLKSRGADEGLRLLKETALSECVLEELRDPWDDPEILRRTQSRIKGGHASFELGILLLVWDSYIQMKDRSGGEAAIAVVRSLLKRLKFSNLESDAILWVLKNQSLFFEPQSQRAAIVIRALAQPAAPLAEEFYSRLESVSAEALAQLQRLRSQGLTADRRLPERWVTGADLQAMGFSKGPVLGRVLEECFHLQLEGTLANREKALAWAKDQVRDQEN